MENSTGKAKYSAILRQFVNRAVPWLPVREKLSYSKRVLVLGWKHLKYSRSSMLFFHCNICGLKTSYPRTEMGREVPTCMHCGSTVRLRSIVHALSIELFGQSLPLADFPDRHDLAGVGLTDWDGYAIRLAKKFHYTNTYYHKEPLLDITSINTEQHGIYDFIVNSDVFEHISPPISKAFENAYRLLKPGGVMIFSVPFVAGETKEHFPDLHDYSIQKKSGDWVLFNRTSDGIDQEFSDLTFHGGPGTVIEMRVFGKDGLQKSFKEAGFASAKLHNEECLKYGIVWLPYNPEEAPYRPLVYGLDAPPWSLRKDSSGTGGSDFESKRVGTAPNNCAETMRSLPGLKTRQAKEESR